MKQWAMYRWIGVVICLTLALPARTSSIITEDFKSYTYRYENSWTDWNIWEGQLSLNKMSAWQRGEVSAVVLPDGSAYFTWADRRGRDLNLFLQKLDRNGNRLWSHDIRINDPVTAFYRETPNLILDGEGGVYCVFQDSREFSPGNLYESHLFAQRINANGQRLWPQDLLISSTLSGLPDTDFRTTQVPGGGLGVVWYERSNTTGDHIYCAQKFNPDSTAVFAQPVRLLEVDINSPVELSELASTPQGSLITVWIKVNLASGANNLLSLWIDPLGQLYTPELNVIISGHDFPNIHRIGVSGLADDSAYIAWCSNDELFVQRVGLSGDPFWAVPAGTDPGSSSCEDLEVQLDSQENLILFWNHHSNSDSILEPFNLQKISKNGQWLLSPTRQIVEDQGQPPFAAYQINARKAWINPEGDVFIGYTIDDRYILAQAVAPDNKLRSPLPNAVTDLDGTAPQFAPRSAAGEDGSTFILWQSRRPGISGEETGDLFLQRISLSGKPLLPVEARLSLGGVGSDRVEAALAVDGLNNAAVAWEYIADDRTEIRVQKINANGAKLWSTDQVVVPGSTADQFQPAVAADSSGNVYVAWTQDNNTRIRMQKFDSNGLRQWGDGIPANATPIDPPWMIISRIQPALVATPQGQVTVAWIQNSYKPTTPNELPDRRHQVVAQRFSDAGVSIWPEDLQVNANDDDLDNYDATDLAIDLDQNGGAYVLIDYLGSENEGGLVQRITPDGHRAWNSNLNLSSPYHETFSTHLTATADGNAVAAWYMRYKIPHIAARKISADGTLLWDADKWVNDLSLRDPMYPWVASFPDGSVTIAYELSDASGNSEVFCSRLNSSGSRILGTTPVLSTDFFYQPHGEAQSLNLNQNNQSILSARLSADLTPNGGSVLFYLSNDGGESWEPVTPGVYHTFARPGDDLRWRAEMTVGPGWKTTPVIDTITVEPSLETTAGGIKIFLPLVDR